MLFEAQIALRTLGYDLRWMAFGLFGEQTLRAQYEDFSRSGEAMEPYRAAAIRDFFAAVAELPDERIDQYLAICATQNDLILAPHYLHELIRYVTWRWKSLDPASDLLKDKSLPGKDLDLMASSEARQFDGTRSLRWRLTPEGSTFFPAQADATASDGSNCGWPFTGFETGIGCLGGVFYAGRHGDTARKLPEL